MWSIILSDHASSDHTESNQESHSHWPDERPEQESYAKSYGYAYDRIALYFEPDNESDNSRADKRANGKSCHFGAIIF